MSGYEEMERQSRLLDKLITKKEEDKHHENLVEENKEDN